MHAWPREGIFIHVRCELRFSRVGISACIKMGGREGGSFTDVRRELWPRVLG